MAVVYIIVGTAVLLGIALGVLCLFCFDDDDPDLDWYDNFAPPSSKITNNSDKNDL